MCRNLQRHEIIVSGGEVNWLTDGGRGERLQAIDLANIDLTGNEQCQNNIAADSAQGSTVRFLTPALESSSGRSTSFVVRARFAIGPALRKDETIDRLAAKLSATGQRLIAICE
jgi:hypothetical protein